MNQYLMWGERGLVATFFYDLHQAGPQAFKTFLSIVEFPEPPKIQSLMPSSVEYLIEPDFSNTGFGHPDAVIIAEYPNDLKVVFIVEAKRRSYIDSSVPVGARGTAGFNSKLNGQLELNYCLTLALSFYKGDNNPLTEPKWTTAEDCPYNVERKGKCRKLINTAVLSNVVSKIQGLPLDQYYHLIITNEPKNPLQSVDKKYLPEMYKPQKTDDYHINYVNDWENMRKQLGWLNYDKMKQLVLGIEPNAKSQSLFLPTLKFNDGNMGGTPGEPGHGEDPPPGGPPPEGRRGVRMIFIPERYPNTFVHFSWKNQAYAIRDYSHSPTQVPQEKRGYRDASKYLERSEKIVEVPNRAPITDVAFWHKKTLELNDKYLSKPSS